MNEKRFDRSTKGQKRERKQTSLKHVDIEFGSHF